MGGKNTGCYQAVNATGLYDRMEAVLSCMASLPVATKTALNQFRVLADKRVYNIRAIEIYTHMSCSLSRQYPCKRESALVD